MREKKNRKILKILSTKMYAVAGFKSWWFCYRFFYSRLQYNFGNRNQKTLAMHILLDWDSLGVYNSVDSRQVASLASEDFWAWNKSQAGFVTPDEPLLASSVPNNNSAPPNCLLLPPRFHFLLMKVSASLEHRKCYVPGRSDLCLDRGKCAMCKHLSLSLWVCSDSAQTNGVTSP